jgi:predicted nucleic acid-binding protein
MNDRRIVEALAYDHHFEQAGFVALLRADGAIAGG